MALGILFAYEGAIGAEVTNDFLIFVATLAVSFKQGTPSDV